MLHSTDTGSVFTLISFETLEYGGASHPPKVSLEEAFGVCLTAMLELVSPCNLNYFGKILRNRLTLLVWLVRLIKRLKETRHESEAPEGTGTMKIL